ncbi:MAG: flagellar FlbD family protein [Candidatus Pelethousia sp.]|nr:flagellar FlbD family protein [Candidatus Pelethousia sp.]
MILVNTMQGEKMYINPDMIETIRATPDTVLFLNTNKRIIVKDTPEALVARIIAYRQQIYGGGMDPAGLMGGPESWDNDK